MASKFHDINGLLLAGADMHKGVFAPTLADMWFMEANVVHPFWMGTDGQEPSVQLNGVASVVNGHEPMCLWPHFPFAPNMLNATFWIDMLAGTQQCWLPRGSVLICGREATITAFFCSFSANISCWEFGSLWSSIVYQCGTIETTPSLGDYLSGISSVVYNLAVDALFYTIFNPPGSGNASSVNMSVENQFKFLKKLVNNKTLQKKLVNKMTSEFVSRIVPWEWNNKTGTFDFNEEAFVNDFLDLPGFVKERTPQGIFSGDVPVLSDAKEGFNAFREHFWGASR